MVREDTYHGEIMIYNVVREDTHDVDFWWNERPMCFSSHIYFHNFWASIGVSSRSNLYYFLPAMMRALTHHPFFET